MKRYYIANSQINGLVARAKLLWLKCAAIGLAVSFIAEAGIVATTGFKTPLIFTIIGKLLVIGLLLIWRRRISASLAND